MRFVSKLNAIVLVLFLVAVSPVLAQDAGDEDLEAAFDLKPKAEKLGDFEEVVKLCKSAIEKGLDEEGEEEAKMLAASALFEQAEQLMIRLRRQRDPTFYRNQAVKLLKEAVEFDPEMGEGWLLIAKLNALRGGDPDEARSAIDQAIDMLDKSPAKQSESYLLRSIMTQKDDREGAREDLDRAIELDDSNVGALRARSMLQLIDGDIEGGIEDVDKVLKINEGEVDALLGQAELLMRMADAKTIAAARKTAAEDSGKDEGEDEEEGDPEESQIPEQSIEQLEADATQIREKVLEICTELVELAPENEQFHLRKVDTLRALDRDEDAMAAVDALIEQDERSIVGLQKKAQLLLVKEENDDETVKLLDQALKLDPYDMATRRLRMQFFTARQQFGSAIVEAEKIIEKEPSNASIMDRLALLYSLNDQNDKAIEVYGALLTRMPMSYLEQLPPRSRPIFLAQKIATLRARGNAYLSTGEHEFAIDDYEDALDLGDQIEEMQASLPDSDFEYTPDDGILNNLACVLSTSKDDDLRDGKRAIEVATLACEITDYKMPHILSTLASAYAEEGDFDEAIKWIEKGLEVNADREVSDLVTEEEIKDQRESLEAELASYKKKEPWRENQAEEDAKKKEAEAKEAEAKESETEESEEKDEPDADADMKSEDSDADEKSDSDADEKSDSDTDKKSDSDTDKKSDSDTDKKSDSDTDKKSDSDARMKSQTLMH